MVINQNKCTCLHGSTPGVHGTVEHMGAPSEMRGMVAVQIQVMRAGAAPAGKCMLVLGPAWRQLPPGIFSVGGQPALPILPGWRQEPCAPHC